MLSRLALLFILVHVVCLVSGTCIFDFAGGGSGGGGGGGSAKKKEPTIHIINLGTPSNKHSGSGAEPDVLELYLPAVRARREATTTTTRANETAAAANVDCKTDRDCPAKNKCDVKLQKCSRDMKSSVRKGPMLLSTKKTAPVTPTKV